MFRGFVLYVQLPHGASDPLGNYPAAFFIETGRHHCKFLAPVTNGEIVCSVQTSFYGGGDLAQRLVARRVAIKSLKALK